MKNEGLLLLKAEKINLIYQNWMKYFWILPIDGQPEPGEIGQYYKWNCEILLLQESLLYVQLKKLSSRSKLLESCCLKYW